MKDFHQGTKVRDAVRGFSRRFGWFIFFLVIRTVQIDRAAAAAVPAVPNDEREIPAAERASWRQVIGWPADCESSFRSTIGYKKSGIVFHDLGDGWHLAQITCAPGAYQGYYVFAAIHGSGPAMTTTLLEFPLFESPDGNRFERREGREVWGTTSFDARSHKLAVLNRFRGPGDCGSFVTYRFQNGRPVVDEARGKARCDGKSAEHPDRWPSIQ